MKFQCFFNIKTTTRTAQKMKFSIKDLVTFIEEVLNGKLHFFCVVTLFLISNAYFQLSLSAALPLNKLSLKCCLSVLYYI